MTLQELSKNYNTQEKCIEYLEHLRWGKERACIFCGSTSVKKRNNSIRWHCASCNTDYSVLMGTIFEDTRLKLPTFFQLIHLQMNAKMGISASEIARDVGIKYQTAWYACHRVRCAMVDTEIKLEGLIEFDEAYIGGKKRKLNKGTPINKANLSSISDKRGRGTKKIPIVGAVEKKGRVYVKIVEKLTGKNLLAMLKKVVKTKGATVYTDEFKSYSQFDTKVKHITIKHKETYGSGLNTVNTIEGFFSLIKNGIKGSFRAISKKYLPFYLAEFSYKYNKRHLKKTAFEDLLKNAVNFEKCMVNYKPKCKDTKGYVFKNQKCRKI